MFYGDGMITPAISVLVAVEGLEIITPRLHPFVVPIDARDHRRAVRDPEAAAPRASALFFGPVMCVWFVVLARARRDRRSSSNPAVLAALNPALRDRVRRRRTRRRRSSRSAPSCSRSPAPRRCTPTWGTSARRRSGARGSSFVMPALVLNYFGQGALLLADPAAIKNPFYLLAPSWALIPLVVLATCADGDRVAGGDLGRVLADARGDPDGLLPAPQDRAHVGARRSARSTCRSSTGRCSSR